MKIAYIALMIALLAVPLLADRDAARFFAERGGQALEAKNWKEAKKQFNKAVEEDAEFLPALLGLARAENGAGKKDEAIRHLETCLDLADRGKLSKEDEVAADEARKLLKEIDRPRLDYREMLAKYVARVMELARSSEKNPGLVKRCLDRVLGLCPDHAEARKMRGDAPESAASASIPSKPGEEQLFNGKDLTGWSGRAPIWNVDGGTITAVTGEDAYYMRTKVSLSGNYSIEYEMRFIEDTGNVPSASFAWGCVGAYEVWQTMIFRGKFRLRRYEGTARDWQDIADKTFYSISGGFERTAWHVFRVDIRGRKVVISVDGATLIEHAVADAKLFDGPVAFFVQGSTVEIRRVTVFR